MKAVIQAKYGSPDVLRLADVPTPIPRDDEVLIKVHAASVNSWDWDRLTGVPFVTRMQSGLLKPNRIPGADVAGEVEAVGRNVTRFVCGDAVFGDLCEAGWGAFAEYVCVPEHVLSPKPKRMTFAQAAATPQAGILALQALTDVGQLESGQRVLINGAGGGVGTFGIQLAKSLGASVTAVDSTAKLDLLRSLGAAQVIDYTRTDFTKTGERYDLIVDLVTNRSIFEYLPALTPTGRYVIVGGAMVHIFSALCLSPFIALGSRKRVRLLAAKPNKGLERLAELFDTGTVKPVIDRCFALGETPAALQRLGTGQALGKLIISVTASDCPERVG